MTFDNLKIRVWIQWREEGRGDDFDKALGVHRLEAGTFCGVDPVRRVGFLVGVRVFC